MKTILRMFALAMLGALALASAARAQITEPGPYYAVPSWDQTLPTATRWIVLTNMGSAAVLDRETGLVWQQNPSTNPSTTWASAVDVCHALAIGGRSGWRLPSVEELATLYDPGTGSLFSGALFTLPSVPFFWTATTSARDATGAFIVGFSGALGSGPSTASKSTNVPIWCVLGYQGAQSPQ